ncbi:hypothetical protein A4A49_24059 [Nicotiana attenuata]|uniref:Uncharacterized protein n=1 Tax=Nicotiana attenuata TaxID=49451 RepID=A0A1J6HYD4_NICAT|nr:hypothetical protein A4A49_24059 [Nicotiana attenuata]
MNFSRHLTCRTPEDFVAKLKRQCMENLSLSLPRSNISFHGKLLPRGSLEYSDLNKVLSGKMSMGRRHQEGHREINFYAKPRRDG